MGNPIEGENVSIANTYVEHALSSGRAILHTMGDHAGESPDVFLARKKADIADLGYTFWYARSVQPPNARQFCAGSDPTFVLFYETKPGNKRKRNGRVLHAGQPTNVDSEKFGYMTHYCVGNRDCDRFRLIPEAMRQTGRYVTGLVDRGACGFVFDDLREVEPERGFNPTEWKSVYKKSSQAGAWCAMRERPIEDKTWYIVAVARISSPHAVWFQGEYGIPPKP